MEQQQDKELREEVIRGKTPLSKLMKAPKKSTFQDALIQVTLESGDELGIRVADRYHTMWNLYLCDKNWYREHGTMLMHMFKNFLVCQADKYSQFTALNAQAMKVNSLLRDRYLILPIVHMQIHDGRMQSLTLQGMNAKSRSVNRSQIAMHTQDFALVDICLNRQWVQVPPGDRRISSLYSYWGSSFSREQITAMGVAFESDGQQIEATIESAFGEAVGVYRENH